MDLSQAQLMDSKSKTNKKSGHFSIDSLLRPDNYKDDFSSYHDQEQTRSISSTSFYSTRQNHLVTDNPNSFVNLTMSSSDNSKYNVLQVLQPTSWMPDDSNSIMQVGANGPSFPVDICVQNNEYDLNCQETSTNHGSRKQNVNLGQSMISVTPEVTDLMPSVTALATYSMFNWCAKCNASFRMTSDLVLHMRNQHKRDRDD